MRKILMVVFCVMAVVVSAQSGKKLPSAVLVHKSCYNCQHPTYDTLCHFSYEDIILTEDSITFRDMKCIYDYDDRTPELYDYLHDTYLIFIFPNGWNCTVELYNYYSSFVSQYAIVLYRRDFGNTLRLNPYFFKDRRKEVSKLVKNWNQYAP